MGSIDVFAVLTGYCEAGRRKWLLVKDGEGCVLACFKPQDFRFEGEPAFSWEEVVQQPNSGLGRLIF